MSIFDGVASLLNDALGGYVTHVPEGEASRVIWGVFRKDPISLPDDEGREILVLAPTLRVPAAAGESIQRGDVIIPQDGAQYQVMNSQPSGSPATDAFILFELERLFP